MTEGFSAEPTLDGAAKASVLPCSRCNGSGSEPATEAPPDPALPEGEYARVEIMGHDYHTGWVTERDRAGVRVLVIADWDGRVLAEVPGQSLYRYVPLPTPLKRPEPQDRAAITSGDPWGSDDEESDDWAGRNPF
jgi:hypothetical protein